MDMERRKKRQMRSGNYPRPAPFYFAGTHSPAEHFALLGYEYLARNARQPYDESQERDPDILRRWRDTYVAAALKNNEPPKKAKKNKDPEAAAEEVPVELCGVKISWHVELPRLKVWAGNMSLGTIIRPRLAALAEYDPAQGSLFDFRVAMRDKKLDIPIGAAGLDPRGIVSALDAGFSPTELGMAVAQYPAVDLLAIIGLQLAPITRVAWDEYAYSAEGQPWKFRIEKRDGSKYLRQFAMSEKWHSDAMPAPLEMPLRQVVIQLAAEKEMSAYAISHATKKGDEFAVSEDHVKAYLDGRSDMTSEKLDAVLAVLARGVKSE